MKKLILLIGLPFLMVFVLFGYDNMMQVNTDKPPILIAHGANTGDWVLNSRQAVINSLKSPQQFAGIEVDIALTKDQVPVLAHDPWIDEQHCVRTDNQAMQYQLIKDVDFAELTNHYRCGKALDNTNPELDQQLDSLVSLDEFLQSVQSSPNTLIYLDLKIQEGLTASNEDFAKAVLSRWQATNLSNPLYLEAPTLAASEAYRQFSDIPFKTVLAYPPFYADHNWKITGGIAAINTVLNPSLPYNQAAMAQADAIVSPTMVMRNRALKILRKKKVETIVFAVDSKSTLHAACQSGVDMIISDYTTVSHCPLTNTAELQTKK